MEENKINLFQRINYLFSTNHFASNTYAVDVNATLLRRSSTINRVVARRRYENKIIIQCYRMFCVYV